MVTTPMCQEILRLAGVKKFRVTKSHDYRDADVAIVLSETKLNESVPHGSIPSTRFIKLKLNTFTQIEQSIKRISIALGTEIQNEDLNGRLKWSRENLEALRLGNGSTNDNRKIKVKVHSNFLKEIADDLGFMIIKEDDYEEDDYDFLVYPDYMKDKIKDEIDLAGERAVELPSHKNAPLDPIKRAEMRYKILMEKLLKSY